MTTRTTEELDRAAKTRIRAWLEGVYTEPDDILSEEDALCASVEGERVYREYTNWSSAVCIDRAMTIAFAIKANLIQNPPS